MKKARLLIGIITLLWACSCNETASDVLLFWEDTDICPEQTIQPAETGHEAFQYSVWKGERAYAQAVIWSPSGIKGLTVEASDLKSKGAVIRATNVKTQFLRYVMADVVDYSQHHQCGDRTDRTLDSLMVADIVDIVPSVDVAAGHCQPVWVTVAVPEDAEAGTYEGKLTIKGDGLKKMNLPFEVKVSDNTLPAPSEWSFHLDIWQNPYSVARYHGVELWSEEHFDYMRPVMKILADAGQKVITTTIIDRPWNGQTYDPFGPMVVKTRYADGTWSYDYTVFDNWVEFMMGLGIDQQINCYSILPWKEELDYVDAATGNVCQMKTPIGSQEYKIYWGNFLADFAGHLRDKGWFDKTMLAMDERGLKDMLNALEFIYSIDPDFKITLAGGWHPELAEDLDDYCVALAHVFPEDVLAARKAEGKFSTIYTCCSESYPNTFLASPRAEGAWLPLYALSKDYDGYLRWAYNSWPEDPLTEARSRWIAGDSFMVYPEGRSSVRMEKFTEGIQAYEKARILLQEWTAAEDSTSISRLEEAFSCFIPGDIWENGAEDAVDKVLAAINE